MKYLEKENDYNEIIKNDLVLVDFYATWCGPCQLMSKELEILSQQEPNLEILKIDIDKFPDLATKHYIMAVPTLKVYSHGKEIKSLTGYMTKDEIKAQLK